MALYFGFNEQEEYVPPSELIEGLVSKNALTFMYAHPGSGKSIFAMGLAAALAGGEPLFEHSCTPSIVIVACGEDLLGMREKNAAIHCMKLLSDCPEVVIGVLGGEELSLTGDFASQTIKKITSAFEEAENHFISRTGMPVPPEMPRVLIIDTWSSLTPNIDENSFKETSAALDTLQRLQRAGVDSIFVTHHSGKNDLKGLRGHSGLAARADNIWKLRKQKDKVSVTVEKAKHHANAKRFVFGISTVDVKFHNDGSTKSLPYFSEMAASRMESSDAPYENRLLTNEVQRLQQMGVNVTRSILADALKEKPQFASYKNLKKYVDREVLKLISSGRLHENAGHLSYISTEN